MRTKILVTVVVVIIAGGMSLAGLRPLSRSTEELPERFEGPVDTRATHTDGQIQRAEVTIKRFPKRPEGYNQLAAAFIQKARETGDFGFNASAQAALDSVFKLDPDNHDALMLRATLLLAYHRFSEALEEARRAEKAGITNPDIYGVMTDALVELGNYQEAINAAQKMMDLRPDSRAYARASYLRSLHGDVEGAIEAMSVAVKAADPRNPESVGWYRVHLGQELMNAGKRKEGEREFNLALEIFPDYHVALAAKARARVVAGDFSGAIELYKRAQQCVPLPDTAIALSDLYAKLGSAEEAKRQYDLAEFIETSGADPSIYSRQLALFWADHNVKLDEALAIMNHQRAARSDIFTADALAWCLFKKGRLTEAQRSIDEAMRLGTRDARIFYHAGLIYEALGERRRAAKYLKLALEVDPAFDLLQADLVKRKLSSFNT